MLFIAKLTGKSLKNKYVHFLSFFFLSFFLYLFIYLFIYLFFTFFFLSVSGLNTRGRFFSHSLQERQLLWLSICFHAHQIPSRKGIYSKRKEFAPIISLTLKKNIYRINPKYSDTTTPNYTCSRIWTSTIYYPMLCLKLLDEWQTV